MIETKRLPYGTTGEEYEEPFDYDHVAIFFEERDGKAYVGFCIPEWCLQEILDFGRDHPDDSGAGIHQWIPLETVIDKYLNSFVRHSETVMCEGQDHVLQLADALERSAAKIRRCAAGDPVPKAHYK